MKELLMHSDELSRRHFMAHAAKAFLGVSMLPAAGALAPSVLGATTGKATAKNVIYLYMAGGMSHIDTLDPKDNAEVNL